MKIAAAVLGYAVLLIAIVLTNARVRALEGRLSSPRGRAAEAAAGRRPAPAPLPASAEAPPPSRVPGTATPVPAPPADAPEFREAVVRVLEDLRREEDARWQERIRKAGVSVISKELRLTRAQEELLTPIVEEHLGAIQKIWWPGTVVEDGEERALTYEEKVKLSEAARSRVDERVRTFLDGAQAGLYGQWSGRWREEAPKRAGEAGPLRWY